MHETMNDPTDVLENTVNAILPDLHRYCARMVGSVFDAEDVVQDALTKVFAKPPSTEVSNPRGWVFRIAHNTALDHLRRRSRAAMLFEAENNSSPAIEEPRLEEREITGFAFTLFLQLTPLQRSCVILKDVIGYSLQEIADLLDQSVGAVKSALFRARTRLRDLTTQADPAATAQLDGAEAILLQTYVERFNNRDFDALRGMLAEDVKLNLVDRTKVEGAKDVSVYFGNYDRKNDWHLSLGLLDGLPVLTVTDPSGATAPYMIRLEWQNGAIHRIRDYRYARYVLADSPVGAWR